MKAMLVLVLAGMSLGASISSAQGALLPGQSIKDAQEADHFSNYLWGLHDKLEETAGLSFEILYLQDMFWNTRGGINAKDSGEYPRLFGLYLELATGKAGLWENGAFAVRLEHHAGRSPSGLHTGDFQVISNIDAERRNQISELWYKHTFFDSRLWLKLGKMEAGTDFSHIPYGLEFINSSAGLIPTVPVPSYPDQDWGAVLGVQPAKGFSCNFGIYQADMDGSRSAGNTFDELSGPTLIAEPSFAYTLGDLPGSFNIGGWWSGRDFEAFHAHQPRHEKHGRACGLYGFWQQLVWKENPGAQDCNQGFGIFTQYGWAPKDRSEVEDYAGGGVRWTGAIPKRDADSIGLGAFRARFSDQAGHAKNAETAIEFYYKAQLTGWLALQPDIQYVVNPAGRNRNALAVGVRMEFVL